MESCWTTATPGFNLNLYCYAIEIVEMRWGGHCVIQIYHGKLHIIIIIITYLNSFKSLTLFIYEAFRSMDLPFHFPLSFSVRYLYCVWMYVVLFLFDKFLLNTPFRYSLKWNAIEMTGNVSTTLWHTAVYTFAIEQNTQYSRVHKFNLLCRFTTCTIHLSMVHSIIKPFNKKEDYYRLSIWICILFLFSIYKSQLNVW